MGAEAHATNGAMGIADGEPEAFRSFEDFWPHYLREHAKPGTRAVHLLGTGVGLAGVGSGVAFLSKELVLAGLVGAYGLAWTSHALVEKNRPATFTNPLWSLRADFRMFSLWATGGLNAELAKAGVEVPAAKPRLTSRDRRRRAVVRERLKRREDEVKDRRKVSEDRAKSARKMREQARKLRKSA